MEHGMKPKHVRLECGHDLWIKTNPPRKGELMFCYKCDTYTNVGPTASRMGRTYYPDYDWACEGTKEGFTAWCLTEGCRYPKQSERYDWYKLRDRMHIHHLREHSHSSLISAAKVVPIPEKILDNEPPF